MGLFQFSVSIVSTGHEKDFLRTCVAEIWT